MSKLQYDEWFNVYYGQNHEDLIIECFFPDQIQGFYIDIGAQDPKKFSVTKRFYDKGWSGINVEPQKIFLNRLKKARKRDINLGIAIGAANGTEMFREYSSATGLSTISNTIKSSYEEDDESAIGQITKKFHDYLVEVFTLEYIVNTHATDKTINFLKVDVEGYESEVIKGNDWNKIRPQLLCIESNDVKPEWSLHLKKVNYIEFMFDGLNRYFIATEVFDLLSKRFNYARTVLNKIPISSVPFELFVKDINKMQRELTKLNKIIINQDEHIKHLDDVLQTELHKGPVEKLKGYLPYKRNKDN